MTGSVLGAVDAAKGAGLERDRRRRRRDGRPTTVLGMVLAGDLDVVDLREALDAAGVPGELGTAAAVDDAARARLGLRTDELALLAADPGALRLVAFARRTHQALPEVAGDAVGDTLGSIWNVTRELDLLARFDDPFDVAALADWVEAGGLDRSRVSAEVTP